jgi:hypothetical protein
VKAGANATWFGLLGNGPACGKMLIMRLTDLDPERVSAELTGWATAFAWGQARREVQLDWLKFEAVFVARQDGLGDWTADLPGRLATITAGAREQA